MNEQTKKDIANGDAIALIWHIEDVKAVAKERNHGAITDDEARATLRNVERNHDCTYGVNWDSLESELECIIMDRS